MDRPRAARTADRIILLDVVLPGGPLRRPELGPARIGFEGVAVPGLPVAGFLVLALAT